ncbi:MAG: hypothetical protein LC137_02845, partial [Burkholderiales bacterium]|nr:hypothetical protein [Burkholderiales bacterium]
MSAETVTLDQANIGYPGVHVLYDGTHDKWVGSQGKKVSGTDTPTGGIFAEGDKFIAWCLEMAFSAGPYPGSFVVTGEPASIDAISGAEALKLLFTKYASAVNNAVTSAAMQLAIWEIVEDGSDYNLDTGSFNVISAGTPGSQEAIDQAQTWLDYVKLNPTAWNEGYKIVKLTNTAEGRYQDLVTFIPTPLPGAALLFLSALGLG